MPSFPLHHSFLNAFVVLIISISMLNVDAKLSSGKAHLNGAKTESTLVKFAVSSYSTASIDLNITSYGMYEDEQSLRMRVYADDEWPQVKRSPLCSEKVGFARRSLPIVFEYKGSQPDDRPGKTKKDRIETYSARIQADIKNTSPRNRGGGDRPRYFYFTIDDCSLERYDHDARMPDMVYSIRVLNVRPLPGGKSIYDHLPADESGIGLLLMLSFLFSSFLVVVLFCKFALSMGGEVHIAILIVIIACGCNALSSMCELIHRSFYSANGIGIYTLDALSSHFEALSDSMVALILLSIGGGWTLPSDVVGGGLSGVAKDKPGSSIFGGVRNPAGSLLDLLSSNGDSGDKKGGIVALMIILVHAGLAQWGRTFDDDFDTYHALEHPPGRALLMLRFALGLIFVTGVGMVRSGGRCPPSLMSFLTKFGLVGLSYFASLPGVSMFVGSALPYHLRHQALHWGAALVQACSLSSLTWLFVGNADASAYHRLSRVMKHSEGDMTADLASSLSNGAHKPTMWRIGRTKIRLD